MTFLQKIAAYSLGLLKTNDLSDIAMSGLEEGYDSASLRMLAGCLANGNAFQLSEYYERSLKELNLTRPGKKEALITVIKFHADKIIDGQVDPYQGFKEIENIVGQTAFIHSDVMLNDCYIDYISIWEVKGDGLQLHDGTGLSKEQYIDKMKKDLISHLIIWRDSDAKSHRSP